VLAQDVPREDLHGGPDYSMPETPAGKSRQML
jgi:hypothetical protein